MVLPGGGGLWRRHTRFPAVALWILMTLLNVYEFLMTF
ncbi:hypothetical protein FHS44_000566 [Streptosporangium saharense]|uniref:Uncharacterized protein n=1 Tax=Streptosporangium saharense TaxID=1706840 RepID=A0A7W7QH98_9ACTN|nr:hypothetical protein [Streptosporangium saharense]